MAFEDLELEDLQQIFEEADYVADESITLPVLLSLRLGKPLMVEGEPGCGKTELGKVLAQGFDTELIRLQCYKGLTAENALYEWNYTKQLLAVQAGEASATQEGGEEESVFSEDFLLERPLLRALTARGEYPPVLLIDEIDRADEPFEAFLLEVLSDFQVSIPELGTVQSSRPPIVILTSNRTRGLSDALKRRCLYLYIQPPTVEKEQAIVHRKVPRLSDPSVRAVCAVAQRLRQESLLKKPGVAEVLDWARALGELSSGRGNGELSRSKIENTLGCLLKETEDVRRINDELLEELVEVAQSAADNPSSVETGEHVG